MGKLTRKEMEDKIRSRESVMYEGRVITSISDLPSEAELSKGDPVREGKARAELEAEMERLKAEMALLEDSKKASAKDTEKPAPVAKFSDAPKADSKAENAKSA